MPTQTPTSLPAAWAALHSALLERRAVHVSYHGRQRLICPHALGWKNDRAMVLGYQVGGQTSTGTLDPDPHKRWRCLFVDEIELVATDQCPTWQTADNYNPQRPFSTIDEIAVAISTDSARPPAQ
jgi:hypothetical protein